MRVRKRSSHKPHTTKTYQNDNESDEDSVFELNNYTDSVINITTKFIQGKWNQTIMYSNEKAK
jgi:hypothetical protein